MVEEIWAGTIGKYWEVWRPELQGFGEFPLGRMRFFHNSQQNRNIQPKIYDPISQEIHEVQQFNLVIGWVRANKFKFPTTRWWIFLYLPEELTFKYSFYSQFMHWLTVLLSRVSQINHPSCSCYQAVLLVPGTGLLSIIIIMGKMRPFVWNATFPKDYQTWWGQAVLSHLVTNTTSRVSCNALYFYLLDSSKERACPLDIVQSISRYSLEKSKCVAALSTLSCPCLSRVVSLKTQNTKIQNKTLPKGPWTRPSLVVNFILAT